MNNGSPKSQLSLDRDRVMCLLLINTRLMKRAIHMYNHVFSHITNVPPAERQKVAEQYQNLTRRIHCNLQVLTFLHEKYHIDNPSGQSNNKAAFPLIIGPPADIPEVNDLYTKLQALYPEAVQFIKLKMQQLKDQQAHAKSNAITSQPQQMMMMNSPMSNSPMSNSPMMGNITPNLMTMHSNRQLLQQYNQYPKGNNMNQGINMNNINQNTTNMNINQNMNMNQNINQTMNMNLMQQQAVSPQQVFQQMDASPDNAYLNLFN